MALLATKSSGSQWDTLLKASYRPKTPRLEESIGTRGMGENAGFGR
jgi:hypothetical protein